MADPVEPVPSAPPAEPRDVETNPSAPPREPFDVKVSLSQPPAAPFDVPIYPDAPPTNPFDVPVSVDAPPGAPVDVVVNPDGPPVEPVDVTTRPDAPPGEPFQVAIQPDLPPATPFDVAVNPNVPLRGPHDVPLNISPGPANPFDVPITESHSPDTPRQVDTPPSSHPWAPHEVDVTLSAPPAAPFDVATTPSGPPAPVFDVPIYPDPPALQIAGRPGELPTIDAIIGAVVDFDRTLGTFLGALVEIEPVHVNGPGAGALDPTILARWLRDYTLTVGAQGIANFITEQSTLYAMNPVTARVFDPTYFLKMLIPGAMGNVQTTLDVESGITMETVAIVRDKALSAAVSANPVRSGGDGTSARPDVYGPENIYSDGQAYSVDTIVDTAIDGTLLGGESPFTKIENGVTRFDSAKFFEERGADGSMLAKVAAKARAAAGLENVSATKLAKSAAIDGIIRVGMPGEETDGSVLSTTQDPSDVIDDDDARVPVSFTDLRQVPGKRYRSVYFRPENLQFSEAIAPEYAETAAFGRVDAVVGYQKTARTVSVTFDVHAMAPEDLEIMYNKMIWLKSMCYPSYGADSLIRSGPVVRLRIGDAVGSDLGGLPGVIRSLNFDFADAMWELKRGMKVPRMFKVAVDFLVLHDGPVGIMNGAFGVFQLPSRGATGGATNMADNPSDGRDDNADGISRSPGRFARFGEPRS